MNRNFDSAVIQDFGSEWSHFDQSALSDAERARLFDQYFHIFPWQALPPGAAGFDLGCGSGRWAFMVAPRVGHLHCIDPSVAIDVARKNLAQARNCTFHQKHVGEIPLPDGSMDFGYSLGVLHHVPDTERAISQCTAKLKPGAPFLIYLYYAFDNQPFWFRWIWRSSEIARAAISRLPYRLRILTTDLIAAVIYWPLSRVAKIMEKCGLSVHSLPLSAYKDRSFYSMRTDALDRFGTTLEQRFTRHQVQQMMERAGLTNVTFSERVPFWTAVGYKA